MGWLQKGGFQKARPFQQPAPRSPPTSNATATSTHASATVLQQLRVAVRCCAAGGFLPVRAGPPVGTVAVPFCHIASADLIAFAAKELAQQGCGFEWLPGARGALWPGSRRTDAQVRE